MQKWESKLSNILEWFTEICFVIMFLTTVFQIVSRSILAISCPWTDELARFMYVWITFMGAIITTLNHEHIRVEVVYDRLPKRAQLWLDVVCNIIAIVFCIIAARGGLILVKLNLTASFATLPKFLTYSMMYVTIPLSMISVAALLVINTVKGFKKALNYSGENTTSTDKEEK